MEAPLVSAIFLLLLLLLLLHHHLPLLLLLLLSFSRAVEWIDTKEMEKERERERSVGGAFSSHLGNHLPFSKRKTWTEKIVKSEIKKQKKNRNQIVETNRPNLGLEFHDFFFFVPFDCDRMERFAVAVVVVVVVVVGVGGVGNAARRDPPTAADGRGNRPRGGRPGRASRRLPFRRRCRRCCRSNRRPGGGRRCVLNDTQKNEKP